MRYDVGLFKSKQERQMERDIEIRKGINAIKRNLKSLQQYEDKYLEKARKAKQIGAQKQLVFLKKTLKRNASQKILLERQLLAIETAMQIKNQSQSQAQFIKSMNALSKSISLSFSSVDMNVSQKDFASALSKAESMEQRMELFLDMSCDMMGENAENNVVDDKEIDAMIDEQIQQDESGGIDDEIIKEIEEIEKELGDK